MQDKFTLGGISRQSYLLTVLNLRRVADADVTTFGLVALGLFFWGATWSLLRVRQARDRLVLVWSGGVVVFVLFFTIMQQWHPYAFRYFVLAAPWIAIVGAWAIEQLRAPAKKLVWATTMLATISVGWFITMNTHQAGWRTVKNPQSSIMFFINQQWRSWAGQLDTKSEPLVVALQGELTLAGFFRQTPPRYVTLQPPPPEASPTAEAWLAGHSGWGIVQASRFIGREGETITKVLLFDGSENSPLSLAAYRRRGPGEIPPPVLYRHQEIKAENRYTHKLLIKTWSDKQVKLRLTNPGNRTYGYQLITPESVSRGTLGSSATLTLTTHLSADSVNEAVLTFESAESPSSSEQAPVVELVP